MLKIGITGGIGSGKTTVCHVFELLGIPVYYADEAARKILMSDPDIKDKIVRSFGDGVLDDHKTLNRKKIAQLVFGSAEKLSTLNAIIHPAVALDFQKWLKNHPAGYIVKEAAILFETGTDKQLDKIVTVIAPEEIRISRVVKRDRINEDAVRIRIHTQLSDEEKIKRSAYVLVNDEKQLVIPQVLVLHEKFLSLSEHTA